MSSILSPREVLIAGSRLRAGQGLANPTRSRSLHLAPGSEASEHSAPVLSCERWLAKIQFSSPPFVSEPAVFALTMLCHQPPLLPDTHTVPPAFSLQQQNTVESLGPSLHYFKKPIIRHQSIYVIRKSLPLQSRLSSLHTVITGTKSIFNHFTDWAHQLSRNIVSCLLCESNIWAKTITLLCCSAPPKKPRRHFPTPWTLFPSLCVSRRLSPSSFSLALSFTPCPWLGHAGSHLKLYKSIRYNKLLLPERERKEAKTTYCLFNTSLCCVFSALFSCPLLLSSMFCIITILSSRRCF